MPPKKAKNAANQHDKRHESGLAPPGRRITKQKSNLALNGNVNGTAQPPTPPLSQDVNQHMTQPASPIDSTHGLLAQGNPAGQSSGRSLEERSYFSSEVPLDSSEGCRLDNTNGSFDHTLSGTPRRADASGIRTATAYKGSSMLTVASTILSSCPLRDVLAILIILLQLPPTVLTIVQFLFATLTFVPPQTGASLNALSAFPSFTDIFQGSGGTPSLFTIIFADAFILVLWLVLWVPVQNFFLDLAQAVIAIALGGAAAGKNGTTNSIFICFTIILFTHLFRFRPLRQHIVHFLWTGLSRGGLDFLTSPPSTPIYSEDFQTPHGWTRTVLGVHIVAQGVVRIIRRSLSRREASRSMPTGKKTDPEAAVHPLPRSSSTSVDTNADLPSSSSTDGRPPGPSPANKDKALNTRKKKKQATHVRSQQPFWAALASTKVTVLKEMESGRAANDATEANAKDTNHIGNAVWRLEEDRVWISEIGPTDIAFRVSMCNGENFGRLGDETDGTTSSSGIDKSKPFYIRVNGADWSSARIRQSTSVGHMGEDGTGMWVGEIFGLTALSNYFCEFVRTFDHEPFYSASLITSTGPRAEQASVASPPAHQTLRPSSPSTTLKNSIAAADQKLQDSRNRLKRNRKDHKAALAAVKRELDTLTNRLANAGGNDERQRQRALQFNQSIRQAEEAAADFEIQVDLLGDVPEEDAQEAATVRQEWQKERDCKKGAMEELENAKAETDREVSSIESDITSVIQKREKLQQRQSKINEQHNKLTTANQEDLSAKSRKQQERLMTLQERKNIENQYLSNIDNFSHRTNDQIIATAQINQTIRHLENLILQQSQQQQLGSATPEGPLPGTNGITPQSVAFTGFTYPSYTATVGSTPGSLRNGRGRSSSMLSNVSGFTDGFEDEPVSPTVPVLTNPFHNIMLMNGHRNGSHGSGSAGLSSGSSSQSSSQRDPMSPNPPLSIKPIMVRSLTDGSAGSGYGLPSPTNTNIPTYRLQHTLSCPCHTVEVKSTPR
ncbi:hypothetical protein GQ43DRAFT_53195 [Delitschia confertaspora ATCC 74209]|uniref:Ubiquitination network signaling protein n=1 Tax=Delitschia confertaspora ATCC 74209 TaxID=1513339 RepID=A0A9P4JK72_9PLEO|nr:hypothetical protein GQ43DRAFT_53195 [Delitschia confertaspora ATCC 74209]